MFYYQNSFGSRVFFDDLGPPWPKHACTDSHSIVRLRNTASEPSTKREISRSPKWKESGWVALRLEKQSIDDEWVLPRCFDLEDQSLVRILVVDFIDSATDFPVYIKQWDTDGSTSLEFINAEFKTERIRAYRFADWFMKRPEFDQSPQ